MAARHDADGTWPPHPDPLPCSDAWERLNAPKVELAESRHFVRCPVCEVVQYVPVGKSERKCNVTRFCTGVLLKQGKR